MIAELPAKPTTKMLVSIRCTGHYDNGRLCDAVLARINVDHWEEIVAASPYIEQKCKCGKVYSLSEYR